MNEGEQPAEVSVPFDEFCRVEGSLVRLYHPNGSLSLCMDMKYCTTIAQDPGGHACWISMLGMPNPCFAPVDVYGGDTLQLLEDLMRTLYMAMWFARRPKPPRKNKKTTDNRPSEAVKNEET